jgi:hypothetical protein
VQSERSAIPGDEAPAEAAAVPWMSLPLVERSRKSRGEQMVHGHTLLTMQELHHQPQRVAGRYRSWRPRSTRRSHWIWTEQEGIHTAKASPRKATHYLKS